MLKKFALALLSVVSACASDHAKSSPSRASTEAATATASEGLAPGRLPESNVPMGECGMVLWTLDERAPAPIFRYVSEKSGEIAIGDVLVTLTRVELDGAAAFGVYEHQKFAAAGEPLSVVVDVNFALGFDGGVYLERGVVSIESSDGWKTVVPTAGIAGCRGKS